MPSSHDDGPLKQAQPTLLFTLWAVATAVAVRLVL